VSFLEVPAHGPAPLVADVIVPFVAGLLLHDQAFLLEARPVVGLAIVEVGEAPLRGLVLPPPGALRGDFVTAEPVFLLAVLGSEFGNRGLVLRTLDGGEEATSFHARIRSVGVSHAGVRGGIRDHEELAVIKDSGRVNNVVVIIGSGLLYHGRHAFAAKRVEHLGALVVVPLHPADTNSNVGTVLLVVIVGFAGVPVKPSNRGSVTPFKLGVLGRLVPADPGVAEAGLVFGLGEDFCLGVAVDRSKIVASTQVHAGLLSLVPGALRVSECLVLHRAGLDWDHGVDGGGGLAVGHADERTETVAPSIMPFLFARPLSHAAVLAVDLGLTCIPVGKREKFVIGGVEPVTEPVVVPLISAEPGRIDTVSSDHVEHHVVLRQVFGNSQDSSARHALCLSSGPGLEFVAHEEGLCGLLLAGAALEGRLG